MLPEGWMLATVGESCETVSVGIVVNPSSYYVAAGEGIRAFRSGNVRENRVNDAKWVFLSEDGNRKNQKSILRAGDVLVVRTGFSGTACVVPREYEGSNCIDILFARPLSGKLIPEYLCQLTNSALGRKQVLSGQSGLAQKHLNVSSYKNMHFGLPSVDEQRRIASALGVWDKAIAVTESLLANSRAQLRSLSTVLLLGKRQLRGFAGERRRHSTSLGSIPATWATPKIQQIASQISQKNTSGEDFPVLSCSKHQGLVDSLSYFKKQVFSTDLTTYKVVPRGAFAYATNHIEEGSIGYQNLYDAALVSPMYTVFKANQRVYDDYLYRLLKTERYRQIFEASTNSSVDRRGSLRWNDFKLLHIPLPPLDEQQAISEVLSGAGQEVEILIRQLELLRAEKSELMQQLLTGKRRLRVPTSEAA